METDQANEVVKSDIPIPLLLNLMYEGIQPSEIVTYVKGINPTIFKDGQLHSALTYEYVILKDGRRVNMMFSNIEESPIQHE